MIENLVHLKKWAINAIFAAFLPSSRHEFHLSLFFCFSIIQPPYCKTLKKNYKALLDFYFLDQVLTLNTYHSSANILHSFVNPLASKKIVPKKYCSQFKIFKYSLFSAIFCI